MEVTYRTSKNYLTQTIYANSNAIKIRVRYRTEGSFISWEKLVTNQDISSIQANLDGLVSIIEEIQSDISRKFQTGLTETIECNPEGITIFHVDFPAKYSNVPGVTAVLQSPSESINYADLTLTIYNITASGFDIRLYNRHTAVFTPRVSWIAVES